MLLAAENLKKKLEAVNIKGVENLAQKGVDIPENSTTDEIMDNILKIKSKSDKYSEVVLFEQTVDFQYYPDYDMVFAVCDPSLLDLETENVYIQIGDTVYNAFLYKNEYSQVTEIGFEDPNMATLVGYLDENTVAFINGMFTGQQSIKIYRKENEKDYEIYITDAENDYYVSSVFSFYKDFEAGTMTASCKINGQVKDTVQFNLVELNGRVSYSGEVLQDVSAYFDGENIIEITFTQTRADGKTVSLTINGNGENVFSAIVNYKLHCWNRNCIVDENA